MNGKSGSVPKLPGYLTVLLGMAAVGMLSSIVMGLMQRFTWISVLMYALTFACIFAEFLCFNGGKRIAAVIISLVPLAIEAVTEFVFNVNTDLLREGHYIGIPEMYFSDEISAVDVIFYLGIPALALLFFCVWKEGMKDTIPLIGVLLTIFVLFIEAYVAYGTIRLLCYSTEKVTGKMVLEMVLTIICRLGRWLMYLGGFWSAGHVTFAKKKPCGG